MKSSHKYINIGIFTLFALDIFDSMGSSRMRYQYKDFFNPALFRTLADVTLLIISIFFAVQHFKQNVNHLSHKTISFLFLGLVSVDMTTTFYLAPRIPFIIACFNFIPPTLAVISILHSLLKRINSKFLFVICLIFIILGFIYYELIIIPQNPLTYPLEKEIITNKILYWLYYLGIISGVLGLMRLLRIKIL